MPSTYLSPILAIVNAIGTIVAAAIPILIGVALGVFFWGLVKYIWKGGGKGSNGKNIMIAGLVSLFVMVSVWGIIYFAQTALGIRGNNSIQQSSPTIPGYQSGSPWSSGAAPVQYVNPSGAYVPR